ncbi:rhodanese-like domain-containing protein [Desulfococcus sp.]|uniref:rhodanese-like domain-containing protein n=1 Tax=Desulfococcus sp. TaxID=2025834 RepID=UPI00359369B1
MMRAITAAPMASAMMGMIMIWMIAMPREVMAGASLSDDEKKEIVYGMYAGYKKKFPAVTDVSPLKAMALMKAGKVVFLDIRTAEEMAVSALPGAISKEAFLLHPAFYHDHIIIGYCTISYRSGKFAEEMAAKGIQIRNLAGGLLAWVLEGGKVYENGAETRRIHVYGKKWNYPPAGYDSVVFRPLERLF